MSWAVPIIRSGRPSGSRITSRLFVDPPHLPGGGRDAGTRRCTAFRLLNRRPGRRPGPSRDRQGGRNGRTPREVPSNAPIATSKIRCVSADQLNRSDPDRSAIQLPTWASSWAFSRKARCSYSAALSIGGGPGWFVTAGHVQLSMPQPRRSQGPESNKRAVSSIGGRNKTVRPLDCRERVRRISGGSNHGKGVSMSGLDIYKQQTKQLVRWHRDGNYSIGGRIRVSPATRR